MIENGTGREKTFEEELPYFKESIKEVFDNYHNPNGSDDTREICVIRQSNRIIEKAEKEINCQKAEIEQLKSQLPHYKVGDTVYIIERDETGEAEEYTGFMFLAQTANAVIVTPFIDDYDTEETIEYLISETVTSMDVSLSVFPLEDCYMSQEDAKAALKEERTDND